MENMISRLLGIDYNENSDIIDFYIKKSKNSIINYVNNTNIDIEKEFETQIIDLAVYYYKSKDTIGINSFSQGSRSINKVDGIPKDIRDTLPRYIKGR